MAKVTTGEIDPEIVKALEAILLVAVEPVTVKLLAQVLEQPTSVVEVLCNRLAASYDEAGHGFQLPTSSRFREPKLHRSAVSTQSR